MLRRALYYITHWESWHWFAKYILIAPAWAWFCLRARTLWFFTPSNPAITFGGFAGETKTIAQWAIDLGICAGTIYYRVHHGWTQEEALSIPVRPTGRL